jgi:large subunit ribosomal protein L24
MSRWIRKGDLVKVIAGNNKGKMGAVLACTEERVLVQGVNVRKKHLKRTQESQGPRIIDIECPVHISNVVHCDQDGTPFRLRVRVANDGTKELVHRGKGKQAVYRKVEKLA